MEKWPDPKRPAIICPAVSGARSWPPTSYSRQSGLLYLPLTEWCHRFGPEGFKLLTSGVGLMPAEHPDSADGMMGRLQAMDVAGRKLAWVHHQRAPLSTSVLATAGGVVFVGDLDPTLKAFDDSTGKQLWQAALDDLPSSSVITYQRRLDAVRGGCRRPAQQPHQRLVRELQRVPQEQRRHVRPAAQGRRGDLGLRAVTYLTTTTSCCFACWPSRPYAVSS